MTDQPIQSTEHVVAPSKYGCRELVSRERANADPYALTHAERHVGRAVERAANQPHVVEIPGTRRGEWEYRESFLGVDPWDVAAYVGDLRGQDAVDASNAFLAQLAGAIRQGQAPLLLSELLP